MFSDQNKNEYYQALLNKNSDYEGVFFAAIRTTGIFCRPTCSARKPHAKNCEYFHTAQEALLAGYRPCKICTPLTQPKAASPLIKMLIAAVEENPEKRWKDHDFRELSIDSSTVRRQFKKRFGMTFVAYARARRMGLALKQIRNGSSVIEAQLDTGYESDSGFRDAFSRVMGDTPSREALNILKAEWLDTALGPMISIASDDKLFLLEFVDRRGLEREIERLRLKHKMAIIPGRTKVTDLIERELQAFFKGQLSSFETPIELLGSDFQKSVWQVIADIPCGETRAYSEIAKTMNKPTATRAVARATGSNQLAIIIPCHRVIGQDGNLTGYAGGLPRKKWLLDMEKANV